MTEKTRNEQAAEARRAYNNAWRAKHKDRVKEYNRRYWEKRAERLKQSANEEA